MKVLAILLLVVASTFAVELDESNLIFATFL